jgi:hypothetical protein
VARPDASVVESGVIGERLAGLPCATLHDEAEPVAILGENGWALRGCVALLVCSAKGALIVQCPCGMLHLVSVRLLTCPSGSRLYEEEIYFWMVLDQGPCLLAALALGME